jgi:hypothetical protein
MQSSNTKLTLSFGLAGWSGLRYLYRQIARKSNPDPEILPKHSHLEVSIVYSFGKILQIFFSKYLFRGTA